MHDLRSIDLRDFPGRSARLSFQWESRLSQFFRHLPQIPSDLRVPCCGAAIDEDGRAADAEPPRSIRSAVEGLSDRLLTVRLRELEAHELVIREVTPTIPVQVRYRLSQSGRELIAVLHPMVQWAQRWDTTQAERAG